MHASEAAQNYNGYLWVLCSFVSFFCSNFAFGLFVPNNAKKSPRHVWKWKNIANSMLHSCITGIWSLICFWQVPAMRQDFINCFSISAQGVISLSVGYFMYDFVDMALHDFKRSRELLIHHCLVTLCFGLSVCTNYYQGYSLVALLVEVNSIFLHLRQILLLYGFEKLSILYRVNGVLNIATFVIFRVLTMTGMFHWLITHRVEITGTVFSLGLISLVIIMGMNFQLLFRVWKSDFRKRHPLKDGSQKEKVEDSSQSETLPILSESDTNGTGLIQRSTTSVQNGNGCFLSSAGDSRVVNGDRASVKHE